VSEHPIKAVKTFSTGQVRIHPQHAERSGWPVPLWLFLSRTWGPPRPIHCFLVEHVDGLVLFDAGQDPASVSDPDYFPGGLTGLQYRRLARFDLAPEDGVTHQLRAAGYAVEDVRTVVLSHLHQDHIGGLRELGQARIVVADAEWQEFQRPRADARGYLTRHIDLPGLEWDRITFEATADAELAPFFARHDLTADGSLVLLPTPGHTEGSMSLLVRRPGTELLLVGDLSYDHALMTRGVVPGIGVRSVLEQSTHHVLELAERLGGAAILPAHDSGTAARLEAALDATEP
jgi:glyoxylase-like metal-dependent hydrolase (beta-lactamase superfamily II)